MMFHSLIATAKKILPDFRFWIILFFLLRLYGITNPPLETGHSWRQTFTCMVARNFLEEDPDIFLPRTDVAGTKDNVVASEFPIFNYLIFLVARVCGYRHWYGRLINLIVSSLGVYCFYLVIRRYFGERTGLFSGIVLLSSMWFMFSRKIMPDTFSVSLVLAGLYFLTVYLEDDRPYGIFLFVVLAGLGGLSKIPAVVILAPAVLAVFRRGAGTGKRAVILVSLALVAAMVSAWYFFWQPHLLARFGNQLYDSTRGIGQGIRELGERWFWTMDKFTFVSLHSYVALLFFFTGLYYCIRRKDRTALLILAITLPVLGYFMARAGFVFATHDYYVIPFVPVMALFAGYGLASFRWPRAVAFIIPVMIAESLANQVHDFRIRDSRLFLLNLESTADRVSRKDDPVAITGGANPEEMYYAHRHGWTAAPEDLSNPLYLEKIRKERCLYVFVNREKFSGTLPYPVVYSDRNFVIYSLK